MLYLIRYFIVDVVYYIFDVKKKNCLVLIKLSVIILNEFENIKWMCFNFIYYVFLKKVYKFFFVCFCVILLYIFIVGFEFCW